MNELSLEELYNDLLKKQEESVDPRLNILVDEVRDALKQAQEGISRQNPKAKKPLDYWSATYEDLERYIGQKDAHNE